VPPRWTFVEWERVAWAIRFQSGAEPGPQQKRFSKLSAEQQAKICLHAGILRLAIAAQKCGVKSSSSLRIDDLPHGLLLQAGGAADSPKNSARFTEAKRLMERSLAKSIRVQAGPATHDPGQRQEPDPPLAISIVR